MTTLDYAALFEGLREAYEDRVLDLMCIVRDACRDAGMPATDPYEMHDDEYRWSMKVWRSGDDYAAGDETCIDVTLEVVESRSYGDDEIDGLNFGLSVVEYSGRVLGGIEPFNFTPDVWVDATDAEAVAARWALFAEVVARSAPAIAAEVRG